jgi:cyanophycinase
VTVLALLGSGEFEPWSEAVDREARSRSRNPDGVVLILPTAAAHEGEASFSSWGNKGLAHYERLGIPAEVVPLRVREDADRDQIVRRLDDASLVYFSGGNPARLARALDGSAFWDRLRAAMDDGLPYVGCSAGVAVLAERTFDSEVMTFSDEVWAPGLGYARRTVFGPHWDMVDAWFPGGTEFIVASVRDGEFFVGLDEDTAIVGDAERWKVFGRQGVHVRRDGAWATYVDGGSFELPIELARPG